MNISEEKYLIELGNKIKHFREENNLSQEDLANDCNIPKSQIGRIERAEINTTIRTLIKIASALNIPVKDLIDF
ncbi:helix-turn-helix transcriptional regulator [Flavobacterium alkalisoli]|uniref:Helix-turn-helix transcriptional regulator n=1 Tax=Flavobacterium alkalisoli TaxID=2602769 RepID=A0A5B9FTZ6_9FLAO|nr:helix-turn-helix transcriptional regulator [Flavobacterium alkalisoli]QEE50334.1 helix-turn-helix transcriptional regulator [Flavobacterium alkalisoli]